MKAIRSSKKRKVVPQSERFSLVEDKNRLSPEKKGLPINNNNVY